MHKSLKTRSSQDRTERNAIYVALDNVLIAPLAKHGYVFQIHTAGNNKAGACTYATPLEGIICHVMICLRHCCSYTKAYIGTQIGEPSMNA